MNTGNAGDVSVGATVARGVLAGIVAGAVAAFAMDRFQATVSALSSSNDNHSEPATQQAADAIVKAATGRDLPDADKPLAGQAIHYALGVGLGIVYAVAAEFRPTVTSGYGGAFGLSTATLLDQGAVPAAGLGEAPWKADIAATLYSYASHLVFGGVAEAIRRGVRSTLEPK